MKNKLGEILNKIINFRFNMGLYKERVKDDLRQKYRAIKVKLKKYEWIRRR